MKHRNRFRSPIFASILAALLLLTACTQAATGVTTASAKASGTTAGGSTTAAAPAAVQFPDKLTIFAYLSEHISKVGASSNNDNHVYQEIEKITGTKVNWIHPAAGADIDMAINLLVSSKELPDLIVKGGWKNISGGIASWVDDGVLLELTDLMKTNMPNYLKQLGDRPGALKDLSIDGKIYYVSELGTSSAYRGPVLRGDWLKKLNLQYPKTVNELYDVLVKIRNSDPNGNGQADEWAMSGLGFQDGNFGLGHLLWPFGIHWGFMQKDGKVCYGPLEAEFTDAMTYIHKLYAEKLIDPDYATQDRNSLDGKFMNNQVGYEYGMQPAKMNTALNGANGFSAEGTVNLSARTGSPAYIFGNEYIAYISSNCDTVVTKACKEPAKALAWLDYFFSDKGILLTNYGIEGVSYKLVNGKPVYDFTKALVEHTNLDQNSAKYMYTLMSMSVFPMLQTKEAYYATLPQTSVDAIQGWNASADKSRILPNISLTAEESASINDDLVDINTYIAIQFDKLVTGQTAISEIPAIQKQLADMGIKAIIAIYQTAYNRYLGK